MTMYEEMQDLLCCIFIYKTKGSHEPLIDHLGYKYDD